LFCFVQQKKRKAPKREKGRILVKGIIEEGEEEGGRIPWLGERGVKFLQENFEFWSKRILGEGHAENGEQLRDSIDKSKFLVSMDWIQLQRRRRRKKKKLEEVEEKRKKKRKRKRKKHTRSPDFV